MVQMRLFLLANKFACVVTCFLHLVSIAKALCTNDTEPLRSDIFIGVNLFDDGIGGESRPSTNEKYLAHGYKMAVEEFNSISSKPFNAKLVWVPPETADNNVTSLEDLINNEEIDFLLGGYGSGTVKKEAIVSSAHGIPYVNGGGATSTIYNENDWAFTTLSPISKLAETTMLFLDEQILNGSLIDSFPCRIVLLWEEAGHGREYRQAVLSHVEKINNRTNEKIYEVVYQSNFPYKNEDGDFILSSPDNFTAMLNDMYSQGLMNADVLLVDAHSNEFKLMHEEMTTKFDFSFKFISYGARGSDPKDVQFLESKLGRSTQTLVASQWWNQGAKNKFSREFVARWRKHEFELWLNSTKDDPDQIRARFASASMQLRPFWVGATGYEAARVLLRAIVEAGSMNCNATREKLLETNMNDSILSGARMSFGSNGQASNEFVLVQNIPGQNAYTSTIYPLSEKTDNYTQFLNWTSAKPVCSAKWWNNGFYEECDDHHFANEVEYYYVDVNNQRCENADMPCYCEGGEEIPVVHEHECTYFASGSPLGIVTISVGVIGISFSLLVLFLVLYYYSHSIMKAGQREFLALMCLSSVWLNTSSFVFLGRPSDFSCNARMFMLWVPMCALFGSLVVKVYRIYKIYRGGKGGLRRVRITVQHMIFLLACIVAGVLLIWTIWIVVEPPKLVIVDESLISNDANTENKQYEQCQYFESATFPAILGVYIALMLLVCNMLSYQGRMADSKHLESKSIMFASYAITISTVAIVVIVIAGGLTEAQSVALFAVGSLLTSLAFLGFVVLPKVYFIVKSPSNSQLRYATKSSHHSDHTNRTVKMSTSQTGLINSSAA